MVQIPKPDEIYKHYKGDNYKIILISRLESHPEQILVSYIPLYETESEIKVWTRTLENFLEEVEVDGKKVKRFSLST